MRVAAAVAAAVTAAVAVAVSKVKRWNNDGGYRGIRV